MTCFDLDTKIVLTEDYSHKDNAIRMELYSQAGLGPKNLEASYTPSKSLLQVSPSDTLWVTGDFLGEGHVEVSFGISERDTGAGHIVYPFSKKRVELRDCTYDGI